MHAGAARRREVIVLFCFYFVFLVCYNESCLYWPVGSPRVSQTAFILVQLLRRT